jgi:hypothetical protein
VCKWDAPKLADQTEKHVLGAVAEAATIFLWPRQEAIDLVHVSPPTPPPHTHSSQHRDRQTDTQITHAHIHTHTHTQARTYDVGNEGP